MKITRRSFVSASAGALAAPLVFVGPAHAERPLFKLRAAASEAPLVAPNGPSTRTWLYNGMSPGPVIRARQGDVLRVEVENALEEQTTVHWHGLRIPVEFDGVPVLSQDPIPPGETFSYDLSFADAGTFWYHPHFNSAEQVGRGLHGVLIVDEPEEAVWGLDADREVLWTLDDWRLDREAQIAPFKQFHDLSHGGRIGNVVTVNGSIDSVELVRAGERIRLRLVNVANATTFRPKFKGLNAWLIALDGHPVAPRELGEEGVLLGAGQRADLILDMTMKPGESVITPSRVTATPGYFEAMGARLIRGRFFEEGDQAGSLPVIIVDEKLAERFWPGEDPLGRRLYRPQNIEDLLQKYPCHISKF